MKFHRIIKSLGYALEGIVYSFQTQWNFRIHCLGFLFMNGSAWFFEFTKSEYIICCILSALIFAAELMNTAIESTVDLVSLDSNELAKIAKDCAAGAVLILAICAIIVWGMIVVSHW